MKCWRRGRRVTALPAGFAVASVKLLAQTGMYRPFRIQYLLHCVAHSERSFLEEKSKMRKKKNVFDSRSANGRHGHKRLWDFVFKAASRWSRNRSVTRLCYAT